MKAYFKAVILSIKTYENILKFNFLMEGNRHIDCLHKYFEAVIYRYKKQWRCRDFITTLKYFWTDTIKRKFTQNTMKAGYIHAILVAAATPLGYAIQCYPYAGKHENYDSDLGLGGSVILTLAGNLPSQVGSNYDIITDNFFTRQE